jgi:hypothetical protein
MFFHGWFVAGEGRAGDRRDQGEGVRGQGPGVGRGGAGDREGAGGHGGREAEAGEAGGKTSDTAQAAKDKAAETAQAAKDKAAETAEAAKQKASEATGYTQDRSSDAAQYTKDSAVAGKDNTGNVLGQVSENKHCTNQTLPKIITEYFELRFLLRENVDFQAGEQVKNVVVGAKDAVANTLGMGGDAANKDTSAKE